MKIVSSLEVAKSEIRFLKEVKEAVENLKRLATLPVEILAKSKENGDNRAPSRENEGSLAASKIKIKMKIVLLLLKKMKIVSSLELTYDWSRI